MQVGWPTLIISGLPGSGKSTIQRNLCELVPGRFRRAVTETTREPREGEVDGVDYHFRTEAEFARDVTEGVLAERVDAPSGRYGTPLSEIGPHERASIIVLDPDGAAAVRRLAPSVSVFINVDDEELCRRMVGRGDADPEGRIKDASKWSSRRFEYDAIVKGAGQPREVARSVGVAYFEMAGPIRGVPSREEIALLSNCERHPAAAGVLADNAERVASGHVRRR